MRCNLNVYFVDIATEATYEKDDTKEQRILVFCFVLPPLHVSLLSPYRLCAVHSYTHTLCGANYFNVGDTMRET